MLKYLVFLVVVAVINCAELPPAPPPATIPIVSQNSQVDPEGGFKWSYESADGTKAEQTGEIKTFDKETIETIHGFYSYQDPEGKTHEVHYVADEKGFQPNGDDIAPEIIRNLEYIEAHPQPIYTEETT